MVTGKRNRVPVLAVVGADKCRANFAATAGVECGSCPHVASRGRALLPGEQAAASETAVHINPTVATRSIACRSAVMQ